MTLGRSRWLVSPIKAREERESRRSFSGKKTEHWKIEREIEKRRVN